MESKKWRDVAESDYRPYKHYVDKQMLPVVVCTLAHRVEGVMHITYHHRALDILCGPEPFLPITLAKIYDLATGTLITERDFVAINKSQIVVLYETGTPFSKGEEPGLESAQGSVVQQEPDSRSGEQPDASPKPANE